MNQDYHHSNSLSDPFSTNWLFVTDWASTILRIFSLISFVMPYTISGRLYSNINLPYTPFSENLSASYNISGRAAKPVGRSYICNTSPANEIRKMNFSLAPTTTEYYWLSINTNFNYSPFSYVWSNKLCTNTISFTRNYNKCI